MRNVIEQINLEYTQTNALSSGDKVEVKINVNPQVLTENKVELAKSSKTGQVPDLKTEDEIKEEQLQNIEDEANALIDDYIKVNTTSNNHYKTPTIIGIRESTCNYYSVDYASSDDKNQKLYLSAIVSQSDEESQVIEGTEPYIDQNCNLTPASTPFHKLDLSTATIDKQTYETLQGISQTIVDDNRKKEITERTKYSQFELVKPLIVNQEALTFVYKGEETYEYTSRSSVKKMYVFVYISNVYMEDDKIIDYKSKISVQNGTELSYDEAYGQEFSIDDVIVESINFTT